VRLASYAALGMMQVDDVWLYGWCSLVGLAAMLGGHWASRFVDDTTFNSIMLAVLSLGASLMLFKGFTTGGGEG